MRKLEVASVLPVAVAKNSKMVLSLSKSLRPPAPFEVEVVKLLGFKISSANLSSSFLKIDINCPDYTLKHY